MSSSRKTALRTLKPFLAGAFLALAGRKLFAGRRRIGMPSLDPFGVDTGRGSPGTPPSASALAEGYEVADANGRDLAITIGIFASVTAFAIAAVILSLRIFGGTPTEYTNFTQEQRHHVEPPAPHLQADPVQDLSRFQMQQNAAITTYGNLGHGLAHIPIARAMTLLQGKSLAPVQQAQP